MSHTIGQVKDNQLSSNSSQVDGDSPVPEIKTSKSVSLLSDADYEFLFNQLLEGISHGWDDRRIVKFFNQLGDRGKAQDWIAWLERLRIKIQALPTQSKQRLGTMMIRLGELTRSNSEVKEIGSVAHFIGRELLLGNTQELIWEYAGPDLTLDSSTSKTEEDLSERLPTDSTEINFATIEDTETDLSERSPSSETTAPAQMSEDDLSSQSAPSAMDELETNSVIEEKISQTNDRNPEFEFEPENPNENKADTSSEPEIDLSLDNSRPNLEAADTSSESEIDLSLDNSRPNLEAADTSPESEIDLSLDNSRPNLEAADTSLEPEDPEAIDIQRVIALIQQDETLAQEISQKLNISTTNSQSQQTTKSELESSAITSNIDLDNSSIELIEGWFNLGLKQVSAGEFDKAIVSWEKALKINPNLSEAWHNRGSALGRLGAYEEAVKSFQKALNIDPKNYQAWNDRAHALYQLQQWSQAADSWSNAIKIMPGNHLFWYNRGCALEQLESWTQAMASYEKSLEIKPDFQPARSRYTNLVADNSGVN